MMAQKTATVKFVVVTDQRGKVVGAAIPAEQRDLRTGMVALDGQRLWEVELPKKHHAFASPAALSAALDGAHITPDGKLKLRELKLVRK